MLKSKLSTQEKQVVQRFFWSPSYGQEACEELGINRGTLYLLSLKEAFSDIRFEGDFDRLHWLKVLQIIGGMDEQMLKEAYEDMEAPEIRPI